MQLDISLTVNMRAVVSQPMRAAVLSLRLGAIDPARRTLAYTVLPLLSHNYHFRARAGRSLSTLNALVHRDSSCGTARPIQTILSTPRSKMSLS